MLSIRVWRLIRACGPDHLLEAPRFAGTNPALVPAGGQLGQTLWSGQEDSGALPYLEPRHVLRYLVLTLESGVRQLHVSAQGMFARLFHDQIIASRSPPAHPGSL